MKEKKRKSISETNQFNAYLAEYSALTARCTNIMGIQNVILAALITWLTVMASIVETRPNWFIWVIIAGGQVFGIIAATFMYGYYVIVYYIENEIKPAVLKLSENEELWQYQSMVAKSRLKGFVAWEYSGLVVVVISILLNLFYFFSLTTYMIVGLVLKAILFFIYIHRVSKAVMLRLKIKKHLSSISKT